MLFAPIRYAIFWFDFVYVKLKWHFAPQ